MRAPTTLHDFADAIETYTTALNWWSLFRARRKPRDPLPDKENQAQLDDFLNRRLLTISPVVEQLTGDDIARRDRSFARPILQRALGEIERIMTEGLQAVEQLEDFLGRLETFIAADGKAPDTLRAHILEETKLVHALLLAVDLNYAGWNLVGVERVNDGVLTMRDLTREAIGVYRRMAIGDALALFGPEEPARTAPPHAAMPGDLSQLSLSQLARALKPAQAWAVAVAFVTAAVALFGAGYTVGNWVASNAFESASLRQENDRLLREVERLRGTTPQSQSDGHGLH